jgi:hypothetical protein
MSAPKRELWVVEEKSKRGKYWRVHREEGNERDAKIDLRISIARYGHESDFRIVRYVPEKPE